MPCILSFNIFQYSLRKIQKGIHDTLLNTKKQRKNTMNSQDNNMSMLGKIVKFIPQKLIEK